MLLTCKDVVVQPYMVCSGTVFNLIKSKKNFFCEKGSPKAYSLDIFLALESDTVEIFSIQ